MASLADYKGADAGTGYLPEGWHGARITSVKADSSQSSDASFLTFSLEGEDGARTRARFTMRNKQGNPVPWQLGRLCDFAETAGLTQEELSNYDPEILAAHDVLIGRHIEVFVKETKGSDGKMYGEVDRWRPSGAAVETSDDDDSKDDDLPF